MLYRLYNADVPVASFGYEKGVIHAYQPEQAHLLPKQICKPTHSRSCRNFSIVPLRILWFIKSSNRSFSHIFIDYILILL